MSYIRFCNVINVSNKGNRLALLIKERKMSAGPSLQISSSVDMNMFKAINGVIKSTL